MRKFANLVSKELKHISRDNRTMMLMFGLPFIMLLLYGFAINTDIKNVRVVIVTANMDKETQRVVDRINASNDFFITQVARTPEEARTLIRHRKADMAVLFSTSFANRKYTGQAGVQVMCDGTDPNTTVQQTNYLRQIVLSGLMDMNQQDLYNIRLLYNPQIKSIYYFVPGLMGAMLLLFCAMMTSVSIVREKEQGSMEVLLVSPTRPYSIILAKLVPYLLISIMVQILNLLVAYFILDVPIRGNLGAIMLLSMVYTGLALCLGLLVSIIARRQLTAMLFTNTVLIIPTIMFSDMIFPIESMPPALQAFSAIVPARWFVGAMRKIMIMGLDLSMVRSELVNMLIIFSVLGTLALLSFRKRLD